MRLIDADVLNIITADVEYRGHASAWKKHNVKIVLANDIKKAPTVEIQHGHWIDTSSGQECSECGEIQYGYDNFRHYCPNCGARME